MNQTSSNYLYFNQPIGNSWGYSSSATTITTSGATIAMSPPKPKPTALDWLRSQVEELCADARVAA